jgi:hypothetical protein
VKKGRQVPSILDNMFSGGDAVADSVSLRDYYARLLHYEGHAKQDLIDPWTDELRNSITDDLREAVQSKRVKERLCPIQRGSENQSVGNQIASGVFNRLGSGTSSFHLLPCPGSGYPDRMAVARTGGQKIAIEVKATKTWDPKDRNRRVLTSSSSKMRKHFAAPFLHLLVTIVYAMEEQGARVKNVRLDFLEPTTIVNVRLEASVNHYLLTSGSHTAVVI